MIGLVILMIILVMLNGFIGLFVVFSKWVFVYGKLCFIGIDW